MGDRHSTTPATGDDTTSAFLATSGRWAGRRCWLFADGTILPVLSGGADDDEESDDDSDDDDEPDRSKSGKRDIPPEVERALKKANKEAETLRLKLKEIEDRDKSETTRATERAAELETKAAAAEMRALRAEIGAEKGLPRKFWDRLKGDDEKSLAADADELLAELKPNDNNGRRKGSFDGGTKDKPAPGDDMNALIRKGARRS